MRRNRPVREEKVPADPFTRVALPDRRDSREDKEKKFQLNIFYTNAIRMIILDRDLTSIQGNLDYMMVEKYSPEQVDYVTRLLDENTGKTVSSAETVTALIQFSHEETISRVLWHVQELRYQLTKEQHQQLRNTREQLSDIRDVHAQKLVRIIDEILEINQEHFPVTLDAYVHAPEPEPEVTYIRAEDLPPLAGDLGHHFALYKGYVAARVPLDDEQAMWNEVQDHYPEEYLTYLEQLADDGDLKPHPDAELILRDAMNPDVPDDITDEVLEQLKEQVRHAGKRLNDLRAAPRRSGRDFETPDIETPIDPSGRPGEPTTTPPREPFTRAPEFP